MLKNIFGRMTHLKPNPRYIDIFGRKWNEKSRLEWVRTPDVVTGITYAVLLTSPSLLSGRIADTFVPLTSGLAAAAFGFSVAHGMQSLSRKRALKYYAIDREGRATPPENVSRLLLYISQYKRDLLLATTIFTPIVLVNFALLPKIMTFGSIQADTLAISSYGTAFGLRSIYSYYLCSKLLKGDYTFCGKPPMVESKAPSRVALPVASRPKMI